MTSELSTTIVSSATEVKMECMANQDSKLVHHTGAAYTTKAELSAAWRPKKKKQK